MNPFFRFPTWAGGMGCRYAALCSSSLARTRDNI